MKIFFMALATLSMLAMQAQSTENPDPIRDKLSPEQRAVLHSKRLSLQLDLNASQQSQVQKLLAVRYKDAESKRGERQQARAEGKERTRLTAEERFERQSQQLDNQMAFQSEMKKILTADQFEKWKKINQDRRKQGQKRMAYRQHKKRQHQRGN